MSDKPKNCVGQRMHELAARLYPMHRAITGRGVRQTFAELAKHIPLQITEVPTGTPVLDWHVPQEWTLHDAYIADAGTGQRLIDVADSTLHIVNHSRSVNAEMSWDELQPHLSTVPEFEDRLPYRTGFFQKTWGFCLSEKQKNSIADPNRLYKVVIDSDTVDGSLCYAECVLPGKSERTVILYAHCCHPSLANDNLSGLVVATQLAQELQTRHLKHTYRIVFAPATIGAITWLAQNERMMSQIDYGLVLTLLGDRGNLTYKRSRRATSAIDRIAENVVSDAGGSIRNFTPDGYDERQFCSPGFDLPVGCLMRTPPGEFNEYHTSADNLDFIQPQYLRQSLSALLRIVDQIEDNVIPVSLRPKGEPRLGQHGLYKAFGEKGNDSELQAALMWVLNQADGSTDIDTIANRSGLQLQLLRDAIRILSEHELVALSTD
jgi:aminopeptidase-like protein